MKKYIAFDPMYMEYFTFGTLEKAKPWFIDCDPIPEEYIRDKRGLLKLSTGRNMKLRIEKKNYPCSEDGESDCPYDAKERINATN